jgi:CRP/FNR family cyclic AMP-dependent transcriptional regulator
MRVVEPAVGLGEPRRLGLDGRAGVQRVRVLEVEPALCDGLDSRNLPSAARSAAAATWTLSRGRWQSEPWMFDRRGSLGLMVIEGLIARQLMVGEMEAVELIGPGDVLRPWAEVDREVAQQVNESWIVTRRARLALLDRSFAVSVGAWPEIAANISDRVAMRVGWMALFSAIQGIRRVDDRLLATLWSYSDRWGRVTPGGVLLELDLTHRLLAGVIGARRPSVTTALKALEQSGALTRRRDRSWLLHGQRPAILAALSAEEEPPDPPQQQQEQQQEQQQQAAAPDRSSGSMLKIAR